MRAKETVEEKVKEKVKRSRRRRVRDGKRRPLGRCFIKALMGGKSSQY